MLVLLTRSLRFMRFLKKPSRGFSVFPHMPYEGALLCPDLIQVLIQKTHGYTRFQCKLTEQILLIFLKLKTNEK